MTLSIRQRLTLWHAMAVAMLMILVAISLLFVHRRMSLSRTDAELRRLNDAVATVLAAELLERQHAQAAAEEALFEVVVPGRHLAILTTGGAVLAQRWRLPNPPAVALRDRQERTWTLDGPPAARVVARALPPVPEGFIIVTAAPWEDLDRDRADLLRALFLVIPAALFIAVIVAYVVAGRALQPAAAMAAEAERLSEGSAGRLTIHRRDELGRLGSAFNDLIGRLESALSMRRQFLADASHELRTPVSIAKTAADVALSRTDRTQADYRDTLELVSRQMTRLSRIVSDMLTLARSDASGWPLTITEFYFDELLGDAVNAMTVLARSRAIALETESPAEIQMRGDEGLLHQMLVNLLENAIRHTPVGGVVRVVATRRDAGLVVSVQDSGSGIPESERERIFDRFVRAADDGTPSTDGSGSGLGLAIARRIARAHRGDLRLAASDSSGAQFNVELPLC